MKSHLCFLICLGDLLLCFANKEGSQFIILFCHLMIISFVADSLPQNANDWQCHWIALKVSDHETKNIVALWRYWHENIPEMSRQTLCLTNNRKNMAFKEEHISTLNCFSTIFTFRFVNYICYICSYSHNIYLKKNSETKQLIQNVMKCISFKNVFPIQKWQCKMAANREQDPH